MKERVVVGGGFSSIVNNLRQMATPNQSEYTYNEIREGIKARFHKLVLPNCGDIRQLDHNKVRINRDAYPGFVCDITSGSTRGAARLFSTKVVRRHLERIFTTKYHSLDL